MNDEFVKDDSLDINLIDHNKMIFEAKEPDEHLATDGPNSNQNNDNKASIGEIEEKSKEESNQKEDFEEEKEADQGDSDSQDGDTLAQWY